MMNRILTNLLLLLTSVSAFGQDYKHEVGINAYYERVNHTYLKYSGLQKQNLLYKGAFSVQLSYNYHIDPLLSLRTGVSYSERGFTTENTDYSSSYIQIPLHLGADVYKNRYIQLTPYAGVYVGIPLESSKIIKDNFFSIPVDSKHVDLGIEAGINVGFKLNDVYSVSLIPRMQIGLSNVYQDYYYEKRGNIAFSIGLGIIRKI
ncbi:outer membrane beta-barrel protein [Chryseobacterium hispalense]|uniref:outer membrane beta-barrel protein n=1 Tax=Chryseobacterium hispalense TaxID=1453492 RepID=UPI00391D385D